MRVHQDRASPGQDPRPTVPKKQAKSKYTADRGIPGAFEGETVTRRRFMVGTAHATGAIATSLGAAGSGRLRVHASVS